MSPGAGVPPARPSASICVLRDRSDGLEVLMARRGADARFMPGAWVFPGGVVDAADRAAAGRGTVPGIAPEHAPWVAAALRELAEEAGVWLSDPPRTLPARSRPTGEAVHALSAADPVGAGPILLFANWVTPTAVPYRFDARFYVVVAPPRTMAEADDVEMDAVAWIRPVDAIGAADAGGFLLPFPTRMILEQFGELGTADAVVAHAAALGDVVPVRPRIRPGAGAALEVLLPDDEGYDHTEELAPDPRLLDGAVTVTSVSGRPLPELTVGNSARRRPSHGD